MATEQLIPVVNEVGMMEASEVDLCLVCCSKVKNETVHLNNNNSQLLSNNLIVFYLLRRVLHVPGIELKTVLISCGNPVEWIKLCDKCSELTEQAEQLHQKFRKIERELSCLQQLIWDKARLSINDEAEATIEQQQTRKSSKVWRRLRKHIAYKCNLTKRNAEVEPLVNPFAEGDKLANYLITQKAITAILSGGHSEQNVNQEADHISLLDKTNLECTSSPEIKIEVTPQLDLEKPQLSDTVDHQNNENRLIDNLLQELGEVKVEFDDQGGDGEEEEDADSEEMEVDARGGNMLLDDDKVKEEDVDWNWEPDEDDEVDDADDNDDSEEDHEEEEEDDEVDEGVPEENWSTFLQTAIIPIVKRPPQTQTTPKKLLQKLIRTEDGKIKCRHCDQIFTSASGLNSHEREKHSKTPGAFICDICGGAFNSLSRDYLRKHKQRSHKTNPDGTSAMKNRKAIRTPDGKYKCRHCDQCFMNTSTCLTHENEKHSKNPGGFICDICGRAFNSASYLHCHKSKTHNLKADGTPSGKERNHICDKCGKGFRMESGVKYHKKRTSCGGVKEESRKMTN